MDIWRHMTMFWGEANVPVLMGKSVHNQRIERHNRGLNEQLLSTFRQQFYELESQGALDVKTTQTSFASTVSTSHESTKPFALQNKVVYVEQFLL